ncbi:UNVERIFIED_CONTAM: hypothetical protein GTU68_048909 [Idotea baltica]|nr:hypothetical protein [Idotea baltica]
MISVKEIQEAWQLLKPIVTRTPLQFNDRLSELYEANIYLKREDLQIVRSYKLRGAYNKMSGLSPEQLANGVICSSAGNHAQGFAFACMALKTNGIVYMPATTTQQKIKRVKTLGKQYVEVRLTGDTYDDAFAEAIKISEAENKAFIPPFEDEKVIAGQGTVGFEIFRDAPDFMEFDAIVLPVGGGGLSAGVGSFFKQKSPQTKVIGVEPAGAPAMFKSFQTGKVECLESIDKFVDGAAVKKVGKINFEICQQVLEPNIILVDEGKVCSTILELYNEDAIVAEPAGVLSIAALEQLKEEIKGKNICCILSGGNNDITRMAEIKERSMLYEGLKHYFIIRLPQRAGALKEFLVNVLGPDDDICFFEYTKKNSRNSGPIALGIELRNRNDYTGLLKRMTETDVQYQTINDNPDLRTFLI